MIRVETVARCVVLIGALGGLPLSAMQARAQERRDAMGPLRVHPRNPRYFADGGGRDIPDDARSKPGSGGQLIAFVPSLDLVVTRQTGGSGGWEYEEFLRRACAAVVDAGGEARKPDPPAAAPASDEGRGASKPGARDGRATAGTVLGVRDARLTLDGRPTFLLGMSYYGALGAPEEFVRSDLDDLRGHGFNWVRVWATWRAFDRDVSAVDAEGRPREPFLGRLRWLVAECDRRGLVVDVTLTRGDRRTGEPSRISGPTGGPSRRSSAR